ncbi:MAG: host-nuclease inhibitor Gam family protein [Nitrospiraceae bacterium]|nr:host-nuclease inhibitor Gam family protein [Nitrospiraceae bacterium]
MEPGEQRQISKHEEETFVMRKRVTGALRTWQDVDDVLRGIGGIDLKLQAIEAEMNGAIMAAKDKAKKQAAFLLEQKAPLEASVKIFAEEHRDDLGAKKSMALNFGTVSFRQSTKIMIRNVKRTLVLLKDKGFAWCVRTKEEPDKDQMKDLSDEELKSVGASRKAEDVFGYEVAYEKLKGEAA